MKSVSRCLVVGVVILSSAASASAVLARGGGHGRGRGGGGAGGTLCTSTALLDLSLSNLDIMIEPSAGQKAALDEVKKVATENADTMTRVCAGDIPMSIPAKLAASEQRLELAVAGDRKLRPLVEKFYAMLTAASWIGLAYNLHRRRLPPFSR
jgi:hypothetical protein